MQYHYAATHKDNFAFTQWFVDTLRADLIAINTLQGHQKVVCLHYIVDTLNYIMQDAPQLFPADLVEQIGKTKSKLWILSKHVSVGTRAIAGVGGHVDMLLGYQVVESALRFIQSKIGVGVES
jgi:phosphopentomutase